MARAIFGSAAPGVPCLRGGSYEPTGAAQRESVLGVATWRWGRPRRGDAWAPSLLPAAPCGVAFGASGRAVSRAARALCRRNSLVSGLEVVHRGSMRRRSDAAVGRGRGRPSCEFRVKKTGWRRRGWGGGCRGACRAEAAGGCARWGDGRAGGRRRAQAGRDAGHARLWGPAPRRSIPRLGLARTGYASGPDE